MLAVTVAAIWVSAAGGWQAAGGDCTDLSLKALDVMERVVARGDAAAVIGGKRSLRDPVDRCPQINLARLSLLGFDEARRLAAFGGDIDRQRPTQQALEELGKLRDGNIDLEIEYAETAIRAAVAAAQDERDELDLLLTHARDLTERLAARSRRAIWPRPFNVLAGELWLEVDRFDEARAAFERAAKADASPTAIVGLARSLARLGRREESCRTFARLPEDAVSLRDETRQEFAECR